VKRILVADAIAPEGLEVLRSAPKIAVEVSTGLQGEDLARALRGVHGLIVRSATQVTAAVLEAADALEVVGRAGIGVDNVDVPAATKRGVLVMNTPTGSAVTTAEHALALLFALARNIPQATASMKAGKWEKSRFTGRELAGKTLGILGIGNIGSVVADRARGLKMKVIGHDPFLSAEAAARLELELVSFDELLQRSDFLTIHTPLTAETRGLIGAAALARMKPTAMLIHCARGGIVDEAALCEALKSGRIAGAAVDVFEKEPPGRSPLFALDNFICTPHLGASTDEAQVAVSVAIAQQMADYFNHGILTSAVNFPAISRELLETLAPYLMLAERIGSLAAQVHEGTFERLNARYEGDVAAFDVSAVTSAFLKGLLSRVVDEASVNYVNARLLARERGLEVIESKSARARDYTSLLSLRVVGGDRESTIAGTLFGRSDARIVRINQFRLEVTPEGHAILLHNLDRPGVIGAIGTLLGRRQINISRMQLGLDREKGEALSVWNIDTAATPDLLEEIRKQPHTLSVKALSLGP
jgi:D-3-phosphoglycerate dehydrogenase